MSIASFLRRHFIIPIWVLKDRSPRFSYLKELEKSQYHDLQYLKKKQFNRLKSILEHSYNHTAYYKRKFWEYGVQPKDIQDENDLRKIPILTKATIQDHSEELITNYYKKGSLLPFKTGGSTGKALTVFKDFLTMELEVGSAWRSFKWAGWKIGEPWGRIWGNPPEKRTVKENLRDKFLHPQIYLDTMNLTDKTMLEFVHQWRRTKPTILHGHSHSIYIFAQFCKNQRIEDIEPKGVISTSMMLMPSERKVIESVFKCKVTDLYGCEEVGLIACECERHQGMHLNMENVYVEFINREGNVAIPGEDGAIIVTSLINKAMPLIRYRIEDVGIASKQACPCSKNLPLIEGISGRVADFLVRKDGSLVAGVSLVERTLTAFPGINQMQIIQEDLEHLLINVVKGHSYKNETTNEVIREFKNSVGQDININICFVNEINPIASGKYMFSISKVKNPFIGD